MNKKIVQQITGLIVECFLVLSLMTTVVVVHAATTSLPSASDIINSVGNETGLPSFESNPHDDLPEGVNTGSKVKGISYIASALYNIADFFKYALGSIAVFLLIVSGIQLVMAGDKAEEELKKKKEYFKYAIIGFLLVIIAKDIISNVFYGQAGEVYSTEENAIGFAQYGSAEVRGIYNFIEFFVGALSVFFIVYHAMKMLIATSDDGVTKARKNIMYGLVGLVIIGLSELVIKDIVFADYGSTIDVEKAKSVFASLTNFVSSTMATVAVAMLFYAGYTAVTSFGKEDALTKAKKIAIMAIVGLVLAGAAYAIANTLIDFANS